MIIFGEKWNINQWTTVVNFHKSENIELSTKGLKGLVTL